MSNFYYEKLQNLKTCQDAAHKNNWGLFRTLCSLITYSAQVQMASDFAQLAKTKTETTETIWSVDSLWHAYVTWQEHTVQQGNNGTMCKILPKLNNKGIKTTNVGQMSLLPALNRFLKLFWCFRCSIWTSKTLFRCFRCSIWTSKTLFWCFRCSIWTSKTLFWCFRCSVWTSKTLFWFFRCSIWTSKILFWCFCCSIWTSKTLFWCFRCSILASKTLLWCFRCSI